MAVVNLLILLPGRKAKLIGIHDNDESACVLTGREGWLMFADQELSDFRAKSAENLTLGINLIPFALYALLREIRCIPAHKLLSLKCLSRASKMFIIALSSLRFAIGGFPEEKVLRIMHPGKG